MILMILMISCQRGKSKIIFLPPIDNKLYNQKEQDRLLEARIFFREYPDKNIKDIDKNVEGLKRREFIGNFEVIESFNIDYANDRELRRQYKKSK